MSYTNGLDKPSDYFNTVLYSGNGSTQSITGVGFQPDFVWGKERTSTSSHFVFDVVRGVQKNLHTNTTAAETTPSPGGGLTSFDSDGFSASAWPAINESGQTYVAWNWLADNTSGSSNTDGSITSTVSTNTTAGFSIVGYTGTGANASVGHGLGTAPDCIIVKRREDAGRGWWVYHKSLGATKAIYLHDSAASFTNSWLQNTAPTSTVFTLNSNGDTNGSSKTHIAYCFAEKKGYSKFGTYTGNGNTNGTFVYTGFRPAWVLIKRTDSTGDWVMHDTKRDPFNVMDKRLWASATNAETANSIYNMDFLSNGFKTRNTNTLVNASGGTYIYMAFAENPFVTSTGIPTPAR
jgi:hypothetical protein